MGEWNITGSNYVFNGTNANITAAKGYDPSGTWSAGARLGWIYANSKWNPLCIRLTIHPTKRIKKIAVSVKHQNKVSGYTDRVKYYVAVRTSWPSISTTGTQLNWTAGGTNTVTLDITATSDDFDLYFWGVNTSQTYTGEADIDVTQFSSLVGTVDTQTYTLTCKSGSNQATTKTYTSTEVEYGTSATANITTAPAAISGWTALGWRDDTSAGAKEYDSTGNVTLSANKTLYAVYSRNAVFKSGDGREGKTITNTDVTQYYNTANKWSLTTPNSSTMSSFTNWTKKCWRANNNYAGRNEDDTNIIIATGATYTGSQSVFYAEYTRSITFYSGASQATTKTQTAYFATTYGAYMKTLPESDCAALTNYTKLGWRNNTTASTAQYGFEVETWPNVDNITSLNLYAVYSRTASLTYNANGGTGAPANSTATRYYNTANNYSSPTITLSSTEPTRANYEFLGWGTSSSATTPTYSAGGSYTFTSFAPTIYAVWRILGIVRIYNGSSWDNYFVHIYNGSNWNDRYTPFIYDGSTWVRCI